VVRNALAMMRLLNRETRDDPGAPQRRAEQREHGQTVWELRDGFIADDLRGVLPPSGERAAPVPPAPELEGYDIPIPMDEGEEPGGVEVAARLSILRVG